MFKTLILIALVSAGGIEKNPVYEGGKVVFRFKAPEATSVFLAGTFNNWSTTATPMKKKENGIWEVALELGPGRYEYKFVINGTTWKEDPINPGKVPDPYGGYNSVFILLEDGKIVYGEAIPGETIHGLELKKYKNLEATKEGVIFRFYAPGANIVYLAGTFNNWSPNSIPMKKKEGGIWEVTVKLVPGAYQYKFVINGTTWKEDPLNPAKVDDGYGGYNSVFILKEDGTIELKVPERTGAIEGREIIGELPPLGTPIYLAILWHQHQPRYYKDIKTGEYEAPWVRLHSIKDYYDMAAYLLKYKKIHLTINLTPSLLSQIEDQLKMWDKGKYPDQYVRLTLKDASKLTENEKEFLILNFFSASWPNMIDIWPRYRELRLKRVTNPDGSINVEATKKKYTVDDYRDLQAWFNLAWFDPDFQEGKVVLITGDTVSVKNFIDKGRNFKEEDKRKIIELQYKIMKAVIPLHKYLQEKGQLEVTTTPFYHPIMPLLYDTDLAREATPSIALPSIRFSHPEDVLWHLKKAFLYYKKLFNRKPRGLWPSEGAVAQAIVPIVREAGFKWMASDVQVLARSLNKTYLTYEDRYYPYRAISEKGSIYIVFRDTDLSDRIGFRYRSLSGVQAANDFILKLYDIHRALKDSKIPPLVTVILDGENAWEWYKHDGKEFLNSLYSQLSKAEWVKTCTINEYLEKFETKRVITHLFAGSWVGADLTTWIGEPEENRAWEYLARVREDYENFKNSGAYSEEKLRRAFEEIASAEGSDWFWFFGSDQNAPGGDFLTDSMFRRTLKNFYTILGAQYPLFLDTAIIGYSEVAFGGGVMARGEDYFKDATLLFEFKDPEGDDYGPGYYVYPLNSVFKKGQLDILDFKVYRKGDLVIFTFKFKKFDNPWNAPLGFSHPLIHLYIDTGRKGVKKSITPISRVVKCIFDSKHPWDAMLKIAGWPDYGTLFILPSGSMKRIGVRSLPEENTVIAEVPIDYLGGPPQTDWFYYVLVFSQDGYSQDHIRPIKSRPEEWVLGGAKNALAPPIMDLLDPSYNGKSQKDMLKVYETGEVPVLYPVSSQ